MVNLATEANLFSLKSNMYPGRGIIVGLNEEGTALVQVYWIMGRGEPSRNRVFVCNGGRLSTEVADPSKVKDEAELDLIVYAAMDEQVPQCGTPCYVVSNGKQTDAVLNKIVCGGTIYDELQMWRYEPDSPNNTPRITAVCSFGGNPLAVMSILRKERGVGSGCNRDFYCFETFPAGVGFCITTYADNGNPLPSFRGEPFPVPIQGNGDRIASTYWDAEANYFPNLVSLAVKEIDLSSGKSHITVVNKFAKVS